MEGRGVLVFGTCTVCEAEGRAVPENASSEASFLRPDRLHTKAFGVMCRAPIIVFYIRATVHVIAADLAFNGQDVHA